MTGLDATGLVPTGTTEVKQYFRRELARLAADALRSMPVVVVTGLRQAGKTTFLRNDPVFHGRRYHSLDDFAVLDAARRYPAALLEGHEPVTIDEAQRCPELLVAIKRAVDRVRRPGAFLLSGSANLALLGKVTETLAGRALYLKLTPFTRREVSGAPKKEPFILGLFARRSLPRSGATDSVTDDEILQGGMPPVVTGQIEKPSLWFLGYEQTYLERDLRDLAQVADLVAFRNLMRLAALRTACVLNQSELARDAKLPVSTVSRYLGLLEASFLIERVPPYLRSRSTRLIKSPKLFITDSGIASHATGVDDLRVTSDEPLRGALYETYVFHNLAGILAAWLPRYELGFWSVQGRHEVDFTVSRGREVVAIEVKAGSRFQERDIARLKAFASGTPNVRASILAYNGTESVKLGANLYAVPIATLLS